MHPSPVLDLNLLAFGGHCPLPTFSGYMDGCVPSFLIFQLIFESSQFALVFFVHSSFESLQDSLPLTMVPTSDTMPYQMTFYTIFKQTSITSHCWDGESFLCVTVPIVYCSASFYCQQLTSQVYCSSLKGLLRA